MTVEPEAGSSWHPQLIKAHIHMRGMTLKKLSLDNGLSESACRQALLRSQPAAERVISRFLGIPLHDLWPDRWDAEGLRIVSRDDDAEDSHERDESHCLSGEAV